MAYTGYIALGGNELVNTSRAAAYAHALGVTTVQCPVCPTLHRAVGDLPYTSPDADDAPWFDPSIPASKEFAGLVGLEIFGLHKSFGRREPVALTSGGASLHPLRRAHREIQIRALALAKTDTALSYGFSWLASVLRGGCLDQCNGDSLCFFAGCPPCGPEPDVGEDYCYESSTELWRQVFNVGLLEQEEPSDIVSFAGGYMAEVKMTLAAGNPFIYSEPRELTGPVTQDIVVPFNPVLDSDCVEDTDCLRDPLTCPVPPVPILPPLPVDSCFPTGTFAAARTIISVPPDTEAIWAEKVPYIEIRSGALKMERIIIRWYLDAIGTGECSTLDPCRACAEINIAFIPAYSTLVIDGRTETATVDCPGGPGLAKATPTLWARNGAPFVWPTFRCADAMCVEVIAKSNTVATDAKIQVSTVVREDAA